MSNTPHQRRKTSRGVAVGWSVGADLLFQQLDLFTGPLVAHRRLLAGNSQNLGAVGGHRDGKAFSAPLWPLRPCFFGDFSMVFGVDAATLFIQTARVLCQS